MKIVFIRHGESDETEVDRIGFIGQGRDLVPLTDLSIKQAEGVSLSPLLKDSQVIVSSPYTRALQPAAIISKSTGLDIKVEVTHGGVIRRYAGIGLINHCEVCEIDYSKDFKCFGWV